MSRSCLLWGGAASAAEWARFSAGQGCRTPGTRGWWPQAQAQAQCEGGEDKDKDKDKKDDPWGALPQALQSLRLGSSADARAFAQTALNDPGSPQSQGAQFVGGVCVGWLLKKSLKAAALTAGAALLALQAGGYITVDEQRIFRELGEGAAALEEAAKGGRAAAPSASDAAAKAREARDWLASASASASRTGSAAQGGQGEGDREGRHGLPPGAGFVPGLLLGLARG